MSHLNAFILTLFPDMFPGPLGLSLAGKALKDNIWQLDVIDIKTFGLGTHKQVDDAPYGGGAGMVMRPDALGNAIDHLIEKQQQNKPLLIYPSPRGERFSQKLALEFTKHQNIAIVCGRFEGIDERIIQHYALKEVSLGDYILSGGELAALTILDACIRLLPGVVGTDTTHEEESFQQHGTYAHLLEYPHYTRPDTWRDMQVPNILQSGNHQAIAQWRLEQAQALTKQKRKDLWQQHEAAMYLQKQKK